MPQSIIIPKLAAREGLIERIGRILAALPHDCAWRIEIVEHRARRSDSQNRLLWALYTEILQRGGEDMGGWTKDDLHEFFLIQFFGSEVKTLFGRKRHVPLHRSSKLSKTEFVDFVESIVIFMAERGVILDMPDDDRMAA